APRATSPTWCARRTRPPHRPAPLPRSCSRSSRIATASPSRAGTAATATRSSTARSALLDARLIRDPVDLPGLAAVDRERLLEVRRPRRDVRPHEAAQHGPALPDLLVVELAAAVLELADRRDVEAASLLVRPVQAPLVRGRRVQPHRHALDVPGA